MFLEISAKNRAKHSDLKLMPFDYAQGKGLSDELSPECYASGTLSRSPLQLTEPYGNIFSIKIK